MGGAGYTEHTANQDCAPRHSRLFDGGHGTNTVTNRCCFLGFNADVSFEVSGSTSVLRVTLNGIDPSVLPENELELYIKAGSPASPSSFDFTSDNGGAFESIEVASPAAGAWYARVEDGSGLGLPYQLTITRFE